MCTRFDLQDSSSHCYSLVPARSTVARVLGLPAETEGLGTTEGGRSPDLLLPLAVDSLEHSLLGLQGL